MKFRKIKKVIKQPKVLENDLTQNEVIYYSEKTTLQHGITNRKYWQPNKLSKEPVF